MKAISVRAPWWWFILHGGKDIENRMWPTSFRGTVYLHASKWWRIDEVSDDFDDGCEIELRSGRPHSRKGLPSATAMRDAGGCIVGTVDIVDCVRESNSPWFFGDYGFILTNPITLDNPIPFKGALRFFEVPDDLHVCEYQPHPSDEERRCFTCQKLM